MFPKYVKEDEVTDTGSTGGSGAAATQTNELATGAQDNGATKDTSQVDAGAAAATDAAAAAAAAAPAKDDKTGINARFQELTRQRDTALQAASDANERHRQAMEAVERLTGQSAAAAQKKADEEDPQPQAPEPIGDPDEDRKALLKHAGELSAWTARREVRTATAADAKKRADETAAETGKRMREEFSKRREAVLKTTPDYQAVAEDPTLPITQHMAGVIYADAEGPALAYWLGQNRAEAERIAALPTGMQLVEMGAARARMLAERATRKVTNAPPPIRPQGAGASTQKDIGDLSMDEYAKQRNASIAASSRPGARR